MESEQELEAAPPLLDWAGTADAPSELKVLALKLRAILEGSRDPALTDDPDLHFADSAELLLLLERLSLG
jgi:hypothetical protein